MAEINIHVFISYIIIVSGSAFLAVASFYDPEKKNGMAITSYVLVPILTTIWLIIYFAFFGLKSKGDGIYLSVCIVCFGAVIYDIFIPMYWSSYGRVDDQPWIRNISVADLPNYETNKIFTFNDGEVLVDFRACVPRQSDDTTNYFAVAALVPNVAEFRAEGVIHAFVYTQAKNKKCDLSSNHNWYKPIRQAVSFGTRRFSDAYEQVCENLMLPYDKESAYRAKEMVWEYVDHTIRRKKIDAILATTFAGAYPTIVLIVSIIHYFRHSS